MISLNSDEMIALNIKKKHYSIKIFCFHGNHVR